MRNFLRGALTIILFVLLYGHSFGQVPNKAKVLPPRYNTDKKLIEYGWGYLNPVQVRDNMTSLSTRPFDGIVLRPKWPEYQPGFPETVFYPYPVSESYMELDTLASINWSSSLTDNFLFYWVAGGTHADWLNDAEWEIVTANAERISKANAAAKTKGIFFDTETYEGDIWAYDSTLYPNHTLEEVEFMVRQRGNEFIQALETHSPDIKVLCTFGWIGPYWGSPDNKLKNRQKTRDCLIKSFCDGMLEGASGQTKIIDGNEIAYHWYNTINWHWAPSIYTNVSENPFIAPELKSKQETNMQVGHGIYYVPYQPISDSVLQKRLEHHVYEELLCTDEYSWFYSEENQAFWLNPFPPEAKAAILSAKNKIANAQELGFTIVNSKPIYSNDLKIITPVQDQVFNIGDTIIFSVQASDDVEQITYNFSYKEWLPIKNTPAVKKSIAAYPGAHLVFAYSNDYSKLSNPVTFYVSDENSVSVNEIVTENNPIAIYPNPFSSSVTIQFHYPVKNVEAIIFNLHGQKIKSMKNISGGNLKIERDNIASGLYFIQLTQDGKVIATNKLIITD